jgi:hypothetical protein
MDISAWIGVVTLLLAVPLGVISALLTPRVVSYLERRKLIKTHRTRQQELAIYQRVEAFKNGTRDRYPFYISLAVAAVISSVGLAICILLLALKYLDFVEPLNPLWLLALLFALFAILFMAVIATTARQIEQFEQYQAEIRKKWGEDAI